MTAASSNLRSLVTGASSGIGVSFARQLAAQGRSLILVARRKERLEKLADELRKAHGVSVTVLAADLSVPDAAVKLLDAVKAEGLAVDLLINNAGYGMQGRFLDMEMAEVEQMFRLNALSLTHLTQLFAREMVARGHGYILNVASAAAFLPSPFVSAYAASKAYVLGFSEAFSFELRGTGVSLTTLYPGITTTEFNEVAHAKTPPLMNLSILSADDVAKVGLSATFKRKRAAIPGLINKINAFFSTVLPRGFIVHVTGTLLGRANGW